MSAKCLCVLMILVFVTKAWASGLLPGGTNVEKRTETYYVRVSTSAGTRKTRRTCTQSCTLFFWCSTRCRNVNYYVWKTVYKDVAKQRDVYFCKTGWKQDGNECTIPICTSGCQNGGTCTAPDVCKCTAQWTGTTCSQDVNECDPTTGIRHGCQGTCVNLRGGYKCTCPDGHFLASNGKNCTDHDECAGNIHGCQQGCINYPGGYNCTCRAGYTLNSNDKKTCEGHRCENISSPIYGAMQCTGNTTDHFCIFNCNAGYNLRGSSNRSCSANGTWTGDETLCKIIRCPTAPAPAHGFVYTPCDTSFMSECIVGCKRGYFMQGDGKINCNASGIWQPENLSCTKTTACERNPCQHNSICIPISSSRYTCDCSRTGYWGINCHIGYITTPKYPRIIAGIPQSLEFRSSPLSSGNVVLALSSRDVTFTPSFLIFNSTSSHQSVRVVSDRPGIHVIRYSISGSKAVDFLPLKNDIIFIDVFKNATNQTASNHTTTNTELPIGCHELVLKKCPASEDVITLSSTAPWETIGKVTSSGGVVVVRAGKNNFPLSLIGTSVLSTERSTDEKRCRTSQNYSVEELAKNNVFTRSFLDSLKVSFPSWLRAKLPSGIDAKYLDLSNTKTRYLSGEELRQTPTGRRQPIKDESSFSLLYSHNINLTVENDVDILQSRDKKSPISLAVDLCSKSPKAIILYLPHKYVNMINQNSSVLKRLRESGWEMIIYSLQVSKTNSIKAPDVKERFWDGERLISRNVVGMNRNLALLTKVKKSFIGRNINSYLEFDGTMVISVDDLDSILSSPLDQSWLVDLYGNMKLAVQLNVEGIKTNLTFDAAESVSFANFGDGSQAQTIRRGLYISHIFETSPFLNSELAKFVEISSEDGIEAFLETKLQSNTTANKTALALDHIQTVNIAVNGALKFGPLRFDGVGIVLRTQDEASGISLRGTTTRNTTRRYGIIKSNQRNVQIEISGQNSSESVGSFESNVELLGFTTYVNVTFGDDGLRFNTSGKVYGKYEADLSCVSPLDSWNNQRFEASGRFKSGKGSLVDVLSDMFFEYAGNVYNSAAKREAFFRKREQRAKNRLESILSVLEEKKMELNASQMDYNSSKRNLQAAEMNLKGLQNNVSQRVDKLKGDLNKFCPEVKQCPDTCQAGVVCKHCEYKIAGKSKRTCLSTCYKTETKRIANTLTIVPCKRQKCVRVYGKDGLVKTRLQQIMNKLKNNIFSFGRKTDSPTAGSSGSSNGGIDELFPGTRKPDVCHYAESTSNVNPEKLCETDDRNGHWDCSTRTGSCSSSSFRYQKYQASYTCERPCDTHVSTEIIPRSCCETVPCAFKIVNRTCIAKNHFCHKIRKDALQKLMANSSGEIEMLRRAETARDELLYWQIKIRNAEIRLNSAKNLLNFTQDTVSSLRKAYNNSMNSRQNISIQLEERLNLKWLLNTSGITFNSAGFKVEIRNGANFLLPVKFSLIVNGTEQELDAVINFKALNSSLSSIAKKILERYGKFGPKHDKGGRSRRSLSNLDGDYALSSLQKYHKLCSEFTNYEQGLYDLTFSLFNLTSGTKELLKNSEDRNASNTLNVSKIFENFNTSEANPFGLKVDKESYLNSLENDRSMLASRDLRDEALADGFKPLTLNAKLLFRNWFSAMENIFNVVLRNCTGFEDCIVYIVDGLEEMNEAARFPGYRKVRMMIVHLRSELGRLTVNADVVIDEAIEISRNVLSILKDMREVKQFCARAPNITKQPEALTDVGEGRPIVLTCNASGDSLSYNWKVNEDYLTDQNTNTLLIPKATSTNSGNYTCVVTNHISMETSSPAFVMVHSAPSIKVQPVQRLNAIFYTNDSLRCLGESTDSNVTYQWFFKARNSSVFTKLAAQTFSYLNFLPVKPQHQGWYYCDVSNIYAITRSRTSYVAVLNSVLPIPIAKLSITLTQSKSNKKIFKRSEPNLISYEDIKLKLSELLSFKMNENSTVSSTLGLGNNTSKMNSTSGLINGTSEVNNTRNSSTQFTPKVENLHITQCSAVTTLKVCQWAFQYVGKNKVGDGENFKQNADKVIGSLKELRVAVSRLVQAVNNGVLAFELGDQTFSVEKNSVGVEDVITSCSQGTKLEQDFACVDCPPGYHGEIDGNAMANCVPCRMGTYQQDSGQPACTRCPEGFTTTQQGSTDASECKVICPAGKYGQIKDNVGRCLDCPGNTYQPMEGKFTCIPCPDGYVTASKGATGISQCSPEPTTPKRTTKEPTTRSTEGRRTTTTKEPLKRKTTEKEGETTTEKEGETTTGEGDIPLPGALSSSDEKSNAPAIGGALGGFLLLCLLALLALYLIRRRRISRKSSEPIDDRNVVVTENEIELNSWDNPGFQEEEDCRGESTIDSANPMYISSMNSPVINENPLYETKSAYKGSSGFIDVKLRGDGEAADLKVYGSYENGDVISECGNPLYESNPARDREDDVVADSVPDEVYKFGNPLYESLAIKQAQKSDTLKLSDGVVVDEDV